MIIQIRSLILTYPSCKALNTTSRMHIVALDLRAERVSGCGGGAVPQSALCEALRTLSSTPTTNLVGVLILSCPSTFDSLTPGYEEGTQIME